MDLHSTNLKDAEAEVIANAILMSWLSSLQWDPREAEPIRVELIAVIRSLPAPKAAAVTAWIMHQMQGDPSRAFLRYLGHNQ